MTGGGSSVLEEYKSNQDKRERFLAVLGVKQKGGKKESCVVRGHMLTLGSLAGDEKKHRSVLSTPGLTQAEQIPSLRFGKPTR